MASKAAEWESKAPTPNKHLDSPNRARIGKSLKEIEKLLGSQGKGAWPNNSVSSLERAFGEIVRSLDKNSSKDQDVFYALGGFQTIWKIYEMLAECKGESTCVIPLKSLVSAGRVVIKAVHNHDANTSFLLLSNKLALITDILLARLARLEEPAEETMIANLGPDTDPLSASLMTLLSSTIQQVADREGVLDQLVTSRLQDLVSFIVCSGTVDSLASYFQLVRDPIDSSPEVAEFLLTSLQLLTSLTAAVESGGQEQEPSHLFAALQGTELAGTVSMLYGMLLHQGRDSDRCGSPVSLPEHTLAVVTATCTLLHRLVRHGTRVEMIQGVLGQEGISLEFRHIASYLLYYCHHHSQAVTVTLGLGFDFSVEISTLGAVAKQLDVTTETFPLSLLEELPVLFLSVDVLVKVGDVDTALFFSMRAAPLPFSAPARTRDRLFLEFKTFCRLLLICI